MYPELTPAFCTQLSFGVDVRLSPAQIGAIRDSVLALFPTATAPWYFRDIYEKGDALYQIAASVGASGRTQPDKPYNIFVLLSRINERGFETPAVRDLFQILGPVEPSPTLCAAQFIVPLEQGAPPLPLWQEIPEISLGRLLVESYTVAVQNDDQSMLGSVLVSQSDPNVLSYTASFSAMGSPSDEFIDEVFRRGVTLMAHVLHQTGKGASRGPDVG
jgi:hypothetical protein